MNGAAAERGRDEATGPRRAAPKAAQPPRGAATRAAAERGGSPKPRFIDHYLGDLLGQANHALFKDFAAVVRDAGLRGIEWRVLATLHDSPPLAISVLAQEVLSKQPTVTKLVQRMVGQGWVALLLDPDDHRRTLVTVTPAGRGLVSPLVEVARRHEASVLGALSQVEKRALRKLLAKLTQGG